MEAELRELGEGLFVIEVEDRAETFGPFSLPELEAILEAIEVYINDL